jgi:hypothetical protein
MLYNACKAYGNSGQLVRASEKKRGNSFFSFKGGKMEEKGGPRHKERKIQ